MFATREDLGLQILEVRRREKGRAWMQGEWLRRRIVEMTEEGNKLERLKDLGPVQLLVTIRGAKWSLIRLRGSRCLQPISSFCSVVLQSKDGLWNLSSWPQIQFYHTTFEMSPNVSTISDISSFISTGFCSSLSTDTAFTSIRPHATICSNQERGSLVTFKENPWEVNLCRICTPMLPIFLVGSKNTPACSEGKYWIAWDFSKCVWSRFRIRQT